MRLAISLAVCLGLAAAAAAQQRSEQAATSSRGQYLVEQVAQCTQCHTPRNEAGDLLRTRLLQGAPVPLRSPFPGSVWANTAPPIAGLPQYSAEEGVRLLTTGISRTGKPLRPPMPQYRLNVQDARDVIAFLKSMR